MKAPQQQLQYPYSREELSSLDKNVLVDMILKIDSRYNQLGDYVRELVKEKYGRKSERFEGNGQLLLFPNKSTEATKADSEAASTEDSADKGTDEQLVPPNEKPKKKGHSRNQPPENLPHVPVYAKPPEDAELPCQCCGTARVAAREILQNSRYQFVPASFYMEDLYSVVYECPDCESAPQLVASVAEPVVNGTAAPALLAQVAVARGFDHLPFNRQTQIYSRSGVNLSRSTLSDFHAQVARIFQPMYRRMQQILVRSRVICTDDTPVKTRDRSKKKNIKLGRVWIHLGDDDHPVNLFDYTEGRGREGPLTFLKGFTGFLQGDCFSGNLAISAAAGTTLVACIAHARRYFVKSMHNDKKGSNEALAMFQALYEIESTAKELELSTDDIQLMRTEEAVPILETLYTWMQKQYALAQPKSSFAKALYYCIHNWERLTQYVTNGELAIDNNVSEREMKYIAMGEKAWLLFGSDQGGENHAIVLSILSTCRRHGVEPWAYLTDVIQRLAENPDENLEDLLRYKWKVKYPQRTPAEIMVSLPTPKVA
ncbi:IS66 family transposase [bacterium]|nr:IS66 family transposase [bacterium]MBP9808362.1 IS66 family transposase [bacterium]